MSQINENSKNIKVRIARTWNFCNPYNPTDLYKFYFLKKKGDKVFK